MFPVSSMKESQQANDVMQLYVNDINQISISTKSAMIRADRPAYIMALRGYPN
jgi:hypothetical protein